MNRPPRIGSTDGGLGNLGIPQSPNSPMGCWRPPRLAYSLRNAASGSMPVARRAGR